MKNKINDKRQDLINRIRLKYRSKYLNLWTLSNTGNPSKEDWEFMNKYERVMGKLIAKKRKVIYL
jgi:hypothetical protein